MARKKLSREELLAKKRVAEQLRRNKIKLDPEAYQKYKEKEKLRYQKRKQDKKLLEINDMTPRQKRIQRRKWKINSKNFRDRKRRKIQIEQRLKENTPPDTDSDDTQEVDIFERRRNEPIEFSPSTSPRPATRSTSSRNIAAVDLATPGTSSQFDSPKSDLRARPGTSRQCDSPKSDLSDIYSVKRQLRYKASKKIMCYKKQLIYLRRQNEMLRKRLLRNKNKNKSISKSPNTKAEQLLADPNKREDIKKALVFAETIKDNLTTQYDNLKSHKHKKEFKNNIRPACNTLKKYKMLKGLEPKMVRKVTAQRKLQDLKNRIEKDIKLFFESDENSRMTAGKKECITRKKEKKQKRFLVDTLKNLHKRFLETHAYTVSYSLFCKYKPFWVVQPVEKDRETCMCKVHDNMELLAQALWHNKIIQEKTSSQILSNTVCSIFNLTCLERKCEKCINKVPAVKEFDNSMEIQYWLSPITSTKEIKTKKGTKIIKISEKKQHKNTPKVILELLLKNSEKFYIHCANILNQGICATALREQLGPNEVTIHMDFSENYSTKYHTEIQSLHFGGSRNQISLHTAVVYAPGLKPKSICTYSDCLRHDAFAVWGHIVPILNLVEKMTTNVDTLHFITDSTCSQYRNKTINYIITKLYWHVKNLKCVTWNYTEAGHGKGAPDGVGATLKRTADRIVRYGKDIPDVNTFAIELKKEVENVLLEYVSEYDIYEKEYFIPSLPQDLKPFKGMMQVHQIVWNKSKENTIVLRRQSCISELCKDKAVICVHGKHLGFYDLPLLSDPPTREKPVIISNMLIAPGDKSVLVKQPKISPSSRRLPSDVVLLHRSQKFIATGNFDLPFELQDLNINERNNTGLESVNNALSPSHTQDIENLADELDKDISHFTPDLNFNNVFVEQNVEDCKVLTDFMQNILPVTVEKLFECDTDLVKVDPKSPSILTADIEDSENLQPLAQVIKIGNWVITTYQAKKSTKYFIGQIINYNEGDTYFVKFLRRLKGTNNVFTWPEHDDEDCVSKDSIAKILSEPNINRRGQLIFNDIEDFVLE